MTPAHPHQHDLLRVDTSGVDGANADRAAEEAASLVVNAGWGVTIPPETLERLESLDDVIFEALSGDAEALDQSKASWRAALREVEEFFLREAREQYVRRAQSVWQSSREAPAEKLHEGFAALEILTLMSE
ncbi:hypothetical protein Mal64_18740 [Pseudobythopirellula maris]|uniref:Uncharacterized protein n=1 Tax=Pseudobythopirellula maris TaxID=2527991 RepID=A0A5C5ZLR3_9BACT|nr:hypothetical protein [Pseudobythopirellula maris]TWT88394.1 hypothetical protein Mal64_18740 [Pseudobythopirellula maris]